MMQDHTGDKAQKTANCDQNVAHGLVSRLTRPLAIIGMMGAGKSRTGRALALALGLPFIDSDQEIEAACGCTITDYFTLHGEESFREAEFKVLKRLLASGPAVVAAGGGAVVNPATRALFREQAFTIWLQAEPETLARRCAGSTTRPLLQGGDPKAILAALLEKRRPFYEDAASITVSSDAGGTEKIVASIMQALETHL